MDMKTISYLLDIQNDLESLWPTIDFFNSQSGLRDYSTPVLGASRAVEKMIILYANERGYDYNDGVLSGHETERLSPLSLVCKRYIKDIPDEVVSFVNEIRIFRNIAAHDPKIPYGEAVVFAKVFDCFVSWFLLNSTTLQDRSDPNIKKLLARFRSFSKSITLQIESETSGTVEYKIESSVVKTKNIVENGNDTASESSEILSKMKEALSYLKEIKTGVLKIDLKVNEISEKLDELSRQISVYQSLVERQIERAISEDEIDRILSAYSDECTSRIIRAVNSEFSSASFSVEKEKLKLSLGEVAWNKLDSSSQSFLITAKITYNNLLSMPSVIDYSGVCLLVTKAIEVEMSNRFCRDYLAFLKTKYPGKENYPNYPTTLLNKYGKPIKPKDFTLGSVAYVLCYNVPDDLDTAQENNNYQKLVEFVSECLMKDVDETMIKTKLEMIAEGVENIRKDYRNPSAHTNHLQCINAKQCFDLVLDVEKLLKEILDSLDY